MSWAAGVDGCRSGWVVVLCDAATVRVRVAPSLRAVLAGDEAPAASTW